MLRLPNIIWFANTCMNNKAKCLNILNFKNIKQAEDFSLMCHKFDVAAGKMEMFSVNSINPIKDTILYSKAIDERNVYLEEFEKFIFKNKKNFLNLRKHCYDHSIYDINPKDYKLLESEKTTWRYF